MKFTTWQLVVILAILVAGIVCANVFAPGSVATVTAMATTLFAALFVTHDNGPKPPGGPPALTLVSGVLFCLALVGCGAALSDLAQDGNASKLTECRTEARTAFYADRKTVEESLAIYDACVAKKSAGAK